MKPFERAVVLTSERESTLQDMLKAWRAKDPMMMALVGEHQFQDELGAEEFFRHIVEEEVRASEVWLNDLYQVSVRRYERMTHLSIKRIDRSPCKDWRHFQQIKNELCGPEAEGVELYPAESRLVDSANQYHLWVFTEKGFRFPFGWNVRAVTDGDAFGKAKQRRHE